MSSKVPNAVRVAALFGIFFLIFAYLYRGCRFGVDLTDEAFYSVLPWKLLPMGDRPFFHETNNAVRLSDQLNYFLVRPFVSFSVLSIRTSALSFYAFLLTLAAWIFFRSRFSLLALMALVACLCVDSFHMPTWSYNWWVRTSLLLFSTVWVWSRTALPGVFQNLLVVLAGLTLSLGVVAYLPLILVWGLALLLIFLKNPDWKKDLRFFLLGSSVVFIGLGIYLGIHRQDFQGAVLHMLKDTGDYSGGSKLERLRSLFHFIWHSEEFWLMALLPFLFSAIWKLKKIRVLQGAAGIVVFCFLYRHLYRFWGVLPDREFVSLAAAGGILLTLSWLKNRDTVFAVPAFVSLAAATVMGMVSVNGTGVMFFACASALLCFVGAYTSDSFREPPETAFLYVLGTVLCLIALRGFQSQSQNTYFDVPKAKATVELKVAPLQGIWTSPRRAFLIEELAKVTQGRNYGVAVHFIPGAYYFSKIRPSFDTVITPKDGKPEIFRRMLRGMVERQRLPEIMIRTKWHPWNWGTPTPDEVQYKSEDPLLAFERCAKQKTLINLPEFVATELDLARVGKCAR